MMGARRALFGTRITVCSLTPSRIGIIASRLTKSNASVAGVNFSGISLGRSGAGACASAIDVSSTWIALVVMPRFIHWLELRMISAISKRSGNCTVSASAALTRDACAVFRNHGGERRGKAVHVSVPACRDILPNTQHPGRSGILQANPEHAARLPKMIGAAFGNVAEVLGGCQRARNLGLHAAVTFLFRGELHVSAVICRIPDAADIFHHRPGGLLEFPGKRARLSGRSVLYRRKTTALTS